MISSPIENWSLCCRHFNSVLQSFIFSAKLGNQICISLAKNLLLFSDERKAENCCTNHTRNYLAPTGHCCVFLICFSRNKWLSHFCQFHARMKPGREAVAISISLDCGRLVFAMLVLKNDFSHIMAQYKLRLIIVFRLAPERIQDLLTSNYEMRK